MSIDVIGALYAPPLVPGEAWTPLVGFHVNVTPDVMTEALEARRVEPSPLLRVWAGDDPEAAVLTVPLRFEAEAEWLAVRPV